VAFVRLLVGRISLGSVVAAAAAAARDAGDDSAAAQAKTVLKQLRLLLKGDAAATAEVRWLAAGCNMCKHHAVGSGAWKRGYCTGAMNGMQG
jgi:hypothetical protein